ncbi:hypothetical protein [Streptomyces sp. AC627_RSS907]|uniref:hypothetical protein n=1 Tax=Streptomyces sp. AC627_RSS907 TaxID=2823684 RepID=UPI001C24CFAF|nr:hypothetical protein [Streptomyces sp. AC627_RSS907]
MAKCKKCGARKRSWPRSCSRCRRSESDWTDTAADAADLAEAGGLLAWIWRGVTGFARLALRALD